MSALADAIDGNDVLTDSSSHTRIEIHGMNQEPCGYMNVPVGSDGHQPYQGRIELFSQDDTPMGSIAVDSGIISVTAAATDVHDKVTYNIGNPIHDTPWTQQKLTSASQDENPAYAPAQTILQNPGAAAGQLREWIAESAPKSHISCAQINAPRQNRRR